MTKSEKLPPVDRFPLAWPHGSPRTPSDQRKAGQFRSGNTRVEVGAAVRRVSDELEKLGGSDAVLSTNMQAQGLLGNLSEAKLLNNDPGVAVYFMHGGKPIVFACDTYTRVADNIAAIGNHVEAIRAIERYGVGRLEQVLVGFQRQLTGRQAWWSVLGFEGLPASLAAAEDAYKKRAKVLHPDKSTGDTAKFAELTEAMEQAKRELEGK